MSHSCNLACLEPLTEDLILLPSDEYHRFFSAQAPLKAVPSVRWLERHNSKLREQGKKDEKKRLKQFVEDAYKRDPRVIAQRQLEKEQRSDLLLETLPPPPPLRPYTGKDKKDSA